MFAMKKFSLMLGVMAALVLASCSKDDDENVWETYAEWRDSNKAWVAEQETLMDEDGVTPFYQKVSPVWNPNEYVLMHWFNNRGETQGNYVPMFTSTVATKYQLFLMDDEKIDSSEELDGGLFYTKVSGVISGWQIALMNMHVGDTVQIVIPYQSAYGSTSQGKIPPYSSLRFNMSLTDIPAYEVKP